MMLEMYAIKDELNGFTPPVPFSNEEVAKRYFKECLINNPTMRVQPKDFSFWYMGEFSTESGTFTSSEAGLKLIERG